jgi:hypothetical protein
LLGDAWKEGSVIARLQRPAGAWSIRERRVLPPAKLDPQATRRQQAKAVEADPSSILVGHLGMARLDFIVPLGGQDYPAILAQDCSEIRRRPKEIHVNVHRHCSSPLMMWLSPP